MCPNTGCQLSYNEKKRRKAALTVDSSLAKCVAWIWCLAATYWFTTAVQNHVETTDIYGYIDSLSTLVQDIF